MHAEMAIAAAKAGKHILCEKPLSNTLEDAERMTAAVREAGVISMAAFNYRRTPAIALAKKLITDGKIGEIRNFRGTYLQDWSADPDGPLSWRFQKSVAGSGALGDIGTHVIDLAHHLVGPIASTLAIAKTYIADRPIQGKRLRCPRRFEKDVGRTAGTRGRGRRGFRTAAVRKWRHRKP